jgi:putative sterol carrier protein
MTDTATEAAYRKIKQIVDETEPDELPATVAAEYGGYDGAAGHLFELYQQMFDPERADGESAMFQFTLTTPEGEKTYLLTVEGGACRVDAKPGDDPTVVIKLSLADFLRMSCGQTNGAMLAMTGGLEVEGDVMAAMSLADWFVTPETDD